MYLIPSSSETLQNICNLQKNNEKSNDYVELRSRSKSSFSDVNWRNEEEISYNNGNNPNRIIIDHKVNDKDTLNSIAIQYSVQVGFFASKQLKKNF